MKLSQVNEAMAHKITEGSEYGWKCWPDARYLDYESDFAYVSVVYNTKTQDIYQAEVSIKPDAWSEDMAPYRWLEPLTKDAYVSEATQRGIEPDRAWDDVNWIDLETEEDFFEKATAIFNGEADFDTRIQVPLDLEDDQLMHLAMEAHKRDITLNEMVAIVLQDAIARHKETL